MDAKETGPTVPPEVLAYLTNKGPAWVVDALGERAARDRDEARKVSVVTKSHQTQTLERPAQGMTIDGKGPAVGRSEETAPRRHIQPEWTIARSGDGIIQEMGVITDSPHVWMRIRQPIGDPPRLSVFGTTTVLFVGQLVQIQIVSA